MPLIIWMILWESDWKKISLMSGASHPPITNTWIKKIIENIRQERDSRSQSSKRLTQNDRQWTPWYNSLITSYKWCTKPYHHMKRTRTNLRENRLSTNNKIIRSNNNQIAESNRPRIDQKSTASKQRSSNCQQDAKTTPVGRLENDWRWSSVVAIGWRVTNDCRLVWFRVSKTGFVI